MKIVLGVDGHKQSHTVVAIDPVGRRLDQLTFTNDPAGHAQAYAWACGLGTERTWGVENSGHLAHAFAQYVLSQGEKVLEVSPHLTGRQRRRSRDASKSDPNDGLAVARVILQEGAALPAVASDDETTQIKVLVEQRDNRVAQRTRLLNQLHGQWTEVDPHYKERLGPLDAPKTLKRCQGWPLPKADPLKEIRITLIRQLARLIRQLNEHIAQLEARLAPLVERQAACLLSILGIHIVQAAQLIARVGSIDRVPSAAALAH